MRPISAITPRRSTLALIVRNAHLLYRELLGHSLGRALPGRLYKKYGKMAAGKLSCTTSRTLPDALSSIWGTGGSYMIIVHIELRCNQCTMTRFTRYACQVQRHTQHGATGDRPVRRQLMQMRSLHSTTVDTLLQKPRPPLSPSPLPRVARSPRADLA